MGRTRTRLTGLGRTNAPGSPSTPLLCEIHFLDPLGNEPVSCTTLDRETHTTTRTVMTPASTLAAVTTIQCGWPFPRIPRQA